MLRKVVAELVQVNTELSALGGEPYDTSEETCKQALADNPADNYEVYIYNALELSRELIGKSLAEVKVRHRLSRRTIQFAGAADHIPTSSQGVDELICLEAEPRLLRSLKYLETTDPSEYDATHRPAAILFDTAGEPSPFKNQAASTAPTPGAQPTGLPKLARCLCRQTAGLPRTFQMMSVR